MHKMDNIIFLCSLPFIDNSYTNVLDFESLSSQESYFNSQVRRQIKGNVISDGEREEFTLNISFQELKPFDYLFLIDHSTNKRFYYFITNKRYKTSNSSIVELELDVFSTYLFDHELLHSFIDRCHVDRWNGSIPSSEFVDEGLPAYDYIITGKEKVAEFNSSYLITATEPLGVLKDAVYNPDSGNNGSSGNNGNNTTISGNTIINSAGYWTIPTTGKVTATYPKYPLSYVGQSHASCSPNCEDCKHAGIDIANTQGTIIRAGRDGTIAAAIAIPQDGFGNYVKIDHGSGVFSYYAHCESILCKSGDVVKAGDVIATMGSTGNSTGSHLHWEIRVNGTAVHPDPNNKLPVGTVISLS